MSRTRMLIALLLALGLAAAGCAPSSVQDDIASLNEKVEALTAKVDALGSRAGGPALEAEASKVFGQVQGMVTAGKIDEAKSKLKSVGTKYAGTKMGSRFVGLSKELDVFGKDTPAKWGVEEWIQGEDAIDLQSKGTTLLVFWEAWCPHCRNEVPKLQQVYNKYHGKGLQMVGMTKMSRNTEESAVREILTTNKVTYPIAKEDGSLANYFAVSGIPAAAVVKGGKIVWRGHPASITDDMLLGWLNS
jgi:thiol-disulfide isomerase/thioredoxin